MPALLVLDTATEIMHLGVQTGVHQGLGPQGEAAAAARSWVSAVPGGAMASDHLLPAIQALLAEAGCALGEIEAIGFGRGPGAFTGLRSTCAVAQGLALGLAIPVLALDTLMAVAQAANWGDAPAPRTVWALMDARMGQVYAAAYSRGQDDPAKQIWIETQAPGLYDPAALAEILRAQPDAGLAGGGLAAYAGEFSGLPQARRDPHAVPGGAALLVLAARAWDQGQTLDAALALPLYVRDHVAQTTAERERARASLGAAGPAHSGAGAPSP